MKLNPSLDGMTQVFYTMNDVNDLYTVGVDTAAYVSNDIPLTKLFTLFKDLCQIVDISICERVCRTAVASVNTLPISLRNKNFITTLAELVFTHAISTNEFDCIPTDKLSDYCTQAVSKVVKDLIKEEDNSLDASMNGTSYSTVLGPLPNIGGGTWSDPE